MPRSLGDLCGKIRDRLTHLKSDQSDADVKAELADLISWAPEFAADTNIDESRWIPIYESSEEIRLSIETNTNQWDEARIKQITNLCQISEDAWLSLDPKDRVDRYQSDDHDHGHSHESMITTMDCHDDHDHDHGHSHDDHDHARDEQYARKREAGERMSEWFQGDMAVLFVHASALATNSLVGLLVAAILRFYFDKAGIRKVFGGSTLRVLPQSWAIGMLLPVCSIGAIPILLEMRRARVKAGAMSAFALSAPLFNPLSLLYG